MNPVRSVVHCARGFRSHYIGEIFTQLTQLFLRPNVIRKQLTRVGAVCPSQHTARLASEDIVLGDKEVRKNQAVIAVMAAGNRDPERFPDPDELDITRKDNRHLAFGWAAHFCFGAALARIEGQSAFEAILRRMPELRLEQDPLVWRTNLGLRGLTALRVTF